MLELLFVFSNCPLGVGLVEILNRHELAAVVDDADVAIEELLDRMFRVVLEGQSLGDVGIPGALDESLAGYIHLCPEAEAAAVLLRFEVVLAGSLFTFHG